MIDFSKCPYIYWSNCAKMSYLQRRIIVYSIMYYENNESCVTDNYYDVISCQLVDMMKEYGLKEYRKTTYYYAMHDFDASTGFNIPSRLTKRDRNYLTQIAQHVHQQWVNDGKKVYK